MAIRSLLAERLEGTKVSDSLADRATYARDSWQRRLIELSEQAPALADTMPSAVVWPETTEQVAALVELARSEGLSLVPFGAGSGVCGGIAPGQHTVVVDLKRLTRFEVSEDRKVLSVGPGVNGIALEKVLGRRELTVGHFPSSIICSTVGGWVAGRGAGQCSSRYGKIEDMVVSAECVLGSGQQLTLRRRSADFNLLPLVIGSEGALGFVTNVELRLHELPRERRFAAFHLEHGRAGMAAVRALMQDNLRPAVARLYDALDTWLMERSSGERHATEQTPQGGVLGRLRKRAVRELLARASLFNRGVDALERSPLGRWLLILIFEGEGADDDLARATRLVEREGGKPLGEAPARRWYEHRYSVSWNQIPVFRAGAFNDTLEVAAPWSRLEELEHSVRGALGKHVVVLEHLSHAYPDGCSIYFTMIGASRSPSGALATYDSAWRDALAAARGAGGAISHHHGIGRSKAQALERDLGPASAVLRRVLRAWDPSGVMNPGVLLPAEARLDHQEPAYPLEGLDEVSHLVTVEATEALGALEQRLAERGFTLGAGPAEALTVGDWVASGLPGARSAWADPAAQVLAGLQADLHTDEALVLPPVPRRATGPDLSALLVGAAGRFGRLRRLTLYVERRGTPPVRALSFRDSAEPAPGDGEWSALWALERAVLGA